MRGNSVLYVHKCAESRDSRNSGGGIAWAEGFIRRDRERERLDAPVQTTSLTSCCRRKLRENHGHIRAAVAGQAIVGQDEEHGRRSVSSVYVNLFSQLASDENCAKNAVHLLSLCCGAHIEQPPVHHAHRHWCRQQDA